MTHTCVSPIPRDVIGVIMPLLQITSNWLKARDMDFANVFGLLGKIYCGDMAFIFFLYLYFLDCLAGAKTSPDDTLWHSAGEAPAPLHKNLSAFVNAVS